MSSVKKSILKNPTPPEWKEADEIVPNLWLGTITNNEQAWRRGITEVICISQAPYTDLKREGFRSAPDLDATVFRIESDSKGNLLPVFGEVYDAIERTLQGGERLLMWDIGGGVAVLAAYIMKKYAISLPEAMTDITRARLKRAKPTPLPSKRIINMLNNENYLMQLEMWQACKCNLFENTIRNPTEPREKWIVEKVRERPQQMMKMKMEEEEDLRQVFRRTMMEIKEKEEEEDDDDDDDEDDVPPIRKDIKGKGKMKEYDDDDDTPPPRNDTSQTSPSLYQHPDQQRHSTAHLPHRLSTIAEVSEEARRLSLVHEDHEDEHTITTIDEGSVIDEDDDENDDDDDDVSKRHGYFGFEIPGVGTGGGEGFLKGLD